LGEIEKTGLVEACSVGVILGKRLGEFVSVFLLDRFGGLVDDTENSALLGES